MMNKVKYESKPDEAYMDRNLCVQVMIRMAQELGYNIGVKENGDWPIFYIDLPTGQVSWHVPTSDFVSEFPDYSPDWDGHDLELKRERIIDFIRKGWN